MVGGCSWEVSSQDLYVLVQWNQLKGMGLYTTNTANSWQFHSFLGSGSELEFLFSVGEVKIQDNAVLSAPEHCCAWVWGLSSGHSQWQRGLERGGSQAGNGGSAAPARSSNGFVAGQRVLFCFRQLFQHRVCRLELAAVLQLLMMCIWSGAEASGSPHPSQEVWITESMWNGKQRSWCLAALLDSGNVHWTAGESWVEVPRPQTAPRCSGEHSCGAGSLQCFQLSNTSCSHWNHRNVLPFSHPPAGSAEALPPSPGSDLTLVLG